MLDSPRKRALVLLVLLSIAAVLRYSSSQTSTVPTPAIKSPVSPPKTTFRVAALQFVSEFGAPQRNRERLAAMIREASAKGAEVVVMPEAAVPGYMSDDLQTAWRDPVRRKNPKDGRDVSEVAEEIPGESTRYFSALARELKLHILVALIEKAVVAEKTNYYNTAVLLDRNGEIALHYRKLNPWPIGEATWAQDGDRGMGICDTEFGRLGVLICFDFSSKLPRRLKDDGAHTLLYPIGWVCSDSRKWFRGMLPEKVQDYGVNVVGANWGLHRDPPEAHDWQGYGYSSIIGQDGKTLAGAGELGETILYADLPLSVPPLAKRPATHNP